MTRNITTTIFGAPKISTPMEVGVIRLTMVGFGAQTRLQLVTTTGRRIAMVTGIIVRPTVGPGSVMNRGVGRLITMAVGFITTIIGLGVRVASFIVSAVGGGRRWSHSFR